MGTLVHMTVYARDQAQARVALKAAFARVAELDAMLSDYQPESELNRLCVARSATVSVDLYRVLEASQRLAKETGGAFDITAGPLIRQWRIARKTGVMPNVQWPDRRIGWRNMTLRSPSHRVSLQVAGMRLDVGGIAKGYVADQALRELARHGIASALVAASGDIAASGPPPGQHAWNVTVELSGGTREIQLAHAAVSTAGDTEQFVEIAGTRYSHIVDPRTGKPLTRPIAVSVVAPTGLEADGLDTALSVLGVARGAALMKHHPHASAFIVTENGPVFIPALSVGTAKTKEPAKRLRATPRGPIP